MACITTTQRQDYESDLAAVAAHIAAIDIAISSGLDSAATQEYVFNSGTGRQSEKFRSPMELLDRRNSLTARRDLLRRILRCGTIIHQQVRR